ncbi:MAG: TonB-dependent receptor [Deltaproteobacteria bacterium]|nr:TonB-dependent receptor [Deltaproteobacteria bacterium]
MQKKHLNPSTTLSRIAHFIALVLFCTAFVLGTSIIATSAEPAGEKEAADESDYILEDTVVTATKTGETLLQETPIAISVFGEELIKTTVSFRLDDLAAFSPNVTISDNMYFIRGIGNQRDWATVEAQVSVYVDGVFLPRGLGSQTDLFDVERVEILRGPQGTLYGKNSTGGSINIITKRPTGELEGTAALEVGNYEKMRFDGTISGPIVENKLNGRFTVKAETGEGYFDILRGPADQDREAIALRGALDFKISDTTSLLLRADYEDQESKPGSLGRVIDGTGSYMEAVGYVAPTGFYELTNDVDGYLKIDQWGVSADLLMELSFGTLRSLTAYRHYLGEDLEEFDMTEVVGFYGWEKETHDFFSQEIQLNGSSGRLDWLVGAHYFYHDELADVWFLMPPFYGPFQFWMDGEYVMKTYAGFATIAYRLTDRFKVEVGGRYSYIKKTMDHKDNYASPGGRLLDNGSWDGFTPKIVAEYQMTDDAMIYGTIAQGFRAGTLDPINPQAGLSGNVDEETVWNYEIGVKSDWLNKRLRVNATVFYMDYQDMVMDYFTVIETGIANVVSNAAESEISGFELEVLARPAKALTLNLNVGYLDSEMTDFRNALDPSGNPLDASGNRLALVPEWSYSLGAQYVFNLGDSGFLTVRGDLTYRGEQFSDVANEAKYELDSLTLVNAFARYETADARWSLDLYGRNLVDEEYYTNKYEGPLGGDLGSVGAPVTYGARLTYNF